MSEDFCFLYDMSRISDIDMMRDVTTYGDEKDEARQAGGKAGALDE